jgi:hypothetical protein
MPLQKGLHPTDLSAISPDSFRLTVTIEGANGKERDISQLVTSMRVYESIFQQTLMAEFDISDGISLFEDLNISGNEKIVSVVRKQNDKSSPPIDIQNDWHVLDIPIYGKPKPDLATYRIRCITPFGLVSKFRRISSPLSGTSIEIIEELYRQVGVTIDKQETQSLGTMKFIPPKLTYSDAISNVLQKSMTPNGSPLFTYQTFHDSAFVLNSYNKMITSDIVDNYSQGYFYTQESQTEGSFEEKRLRILESASNIGFSPYKSMKNGSYVTRTHKLDISNKTYERIDFNAYEDKVPLIDGEESDPVWNRSFTVSGVGPTTLKETSNIFINQNSLAMAETGDINYHQFGAYKEATKRSVYSNLEQLEHSIKLYGDSRLKPGSIINLNFPKTGQVEGAGRQNDEFMSGRYLIVSSTHTFNSLGYFTQVKVRRDSVHKR